MALEASRAVLILLLLFFFFLGPDTRGPSLSRLLDIEKRIAYERSALKVLNTSSYNALDAKSQRWLNLTGLRQDDGYAWEWLDRVQERATEHLRVASASHGWNNGSLPDNRLHPSEENDRDDMQPFPDPLPMFSNITGVIRGKWVRSNLESSNRTRDVNLTALAPDVTYATSKYGRNFTSFEGDIRVKLIDQSVGDEAVGNSSVIRQIKVETVMSDETSNGDGWDATLYGVHFVKQGGVIASTTSEKFDGIFALPHFLRSAKAFDISKHFLVKWLGKTIDKRKAMPDASLNPWSSTNGGNADNIFPTPQCEMVLYLQQHPPDHSGPPFQRIEDELRYPTGGSMGPVPQIHMSAVIFSPDCGFILESKGPPEYSPKASSHLKGRKIELYLKEARFYLILFALLICMEIVLLKRQMDDASTPSTKSRISFYAIFIMAMGDGLACMGCLFMGMLTDVLSLALIATAFLTFLCVGFCGMKFLTDIWDAQTPERQERARERQRLREQRNAATPTSITTQGLAATSIDSERTSAPDTLPLPATARSQNRPSTPIIITPDQDFDAAQAENAAVGANGNTNAQGIDTTLGSARREIGALYVRFYFAVVAILFLSVWATSWPTVARSFYCNLLAVLYLSFWVPQIYRNVMRNCRKALSWRFVIGQSLLRLAPFGYFYTWEQNVLFVDSDPLAFFILVGWVWLQVFVLATQEAVGPRIFVPEGWAPQAYDYHPVLREGDREEGGNMPVGFTEAIASPTSPVTGSASTSTAPLGSHGHADPGRKDVSNKRTFDCAICTEAFDVPVVPQGQHDGDGSVAASAAATLFARRTYMVTPCRHIFHSACLESWMRYRLQCPICREMLPPL